MEQTFRIYILLYIKNITLYTFFLDFKIVESLLYIPKNTYFEEYLQTTVDPCYYNVLHTKSLHAMLELRQRHEAPCGVILIL